MYGGTCMEDVRSFFHETQEAFTIYIVEQKFVVGRGYEYFKSFRGKENLIVSDSALKRRIRKIIFWIQQRIPNAADLLSFCLSADKTMSAVSIVEVISALSKLFSIEKHQAVGPEVIDPLIIEEGKISQRYLSQLIALHQESILQPTIIILLKDNDFDRAKELVSKCPHGINVKMIRNSGESEIYRVINCGANETDEFLDSFSKQCFSTCSATDRKILLSQEWENQSLIHDNIPDILRFRSLLVEENKSSQTLTDIGGSIQRISQYQCATESSLRIKETLLCMLKLFRVYCLDRCTSDMSDALTLAQDVENDILIAHVFRYANFFPQLSLKTKHDMLYKAASIFEKSNVQDHAIYCTNNLLINQFYTEDVDCMAFGRMQEQAIYNVPGMVGMSYIFNNSGVAYLYNSRYDEAIECFEKGIPYAKCRPVQKLGLMTNLLIAKECDYRKISTSDILRVFTYVFDQFGTQRLSFLCANFIANALAVSLRIDTTLASTLMKRFPVMELLQNALSGDQFGTGSLTMQLSLLQNKYPKVFNLPFAFPSKSTLISGIRHRFIENHMCNPTIFNAWL